MLCLPKPFAGLLILAVSVLCIAGRVVAETPAQPADALTSAIAARLELMQGVAQYKWNNSIPIEDLKRERQVLDSVVASAQKQGVPVDLATSFFRAQITAAKAIQTRLFDAWRQKSAGPFPNAPDLKKDVRPAISALTDRIIQALAGLDAMDSETLCAALDTVPAALTADAEAWRIAVSPLREHAGGC